MKTHGTFRLSLLLIGVGLFLFFLLMATPAYGKTVSSKEEYPLKTLANESTGNLLSFDIDSLTFIKNVEDSKIEDPYIYTDTLPFTLIVTLSEWKNLPEDSSLKIMRTTDFNVFYPQNNTEMRSLCNMADGTFTFENLSYTGTGQHILFVLSQEDDQLNVIWTASELVPLSTQGTSSTLSFPSSQSSSKKEGTSSKSSASSKDTTAKSTTSSTLPASLTPHLLPISFTYSDDINGLEPFSVEITLQNVSETLTIENAVITLSTDKTILSIIDSSMVQYIRSLPPKGTYSFKVFCILSDLSQSASFSLSSTFEYYDLGKNSPTKATDKSTIPLSFIHSGDNVRSDTLPASALRLESITLPEHAYDNFSFSLGYRLANVGESDASHVDLSLTDQDGTEISRLFLGVLKYGQIMDSPDMLLTFGKIGTYKLTLTAYYRDGYGVQKSSSKTFELLIEPQEDSPNFVKSKTSEAVSSKAATIYVNTQNTSTFSPWIWLLCLIVIALTVYVIKKIRTPIEPPTASLIQFEKNLQDSTDSTLSDSLPSGKPHSDKK